MIISSFLTVFVVFGLTQAVTGIKFMIGTSTERCIMENGAKVAYRGIASKLKSSSRWPVHSITNDYPVAGTDKIEFYVPKQLEVIDEIPQPPTMIMVDTDGNGADDILVPDWDSTAVSIEIDQNNPGRLLLKENSGIKVLARNVKKINFFDNITDSALKVDELKIYIEFEEQNGSSEPYADDLTFTIILRNEL
jgi:hypothetical protein